MELISKGMLAFFVMTFSATNLAAQKKSVLFDPAKTNEWYVYFSKSGKNNDPQNVIKFEGNVIHVIRAGFWIHCNRKKVP